MSVESFPEDHDDGDVCVGINSFGVGGSYAHAAISPYKPSPLARPRPPALVASHHVLPLSAVSEEHLAVYELSLEDFLQAHPQVGQR